MGFSTSDIEMRVRTILLDTVSPYRWESSDIKDYLSDAIRHLNATRPETRYVNGVLTDYSVPDDNAEAIPIEDRFREAIIYYVVYKCYLMDDTDTVNAQLAESYLAKAHNFMQI